MSSRAVKEQAAYSSISHLADGDCIRRHVRVDVESQPHVGHYWFDVYALSELGMYIVQDVQERQGNVSFDLRVE